MPQESMKKLTLRNVQNALRAEVHRQNRENAIELDRLVKIHRSEMEEWFRRGYLTDETLDSEAIGDTSEVTLSDLENEFDPDDKYSCLDIPDDNYNELENY